MCGMIKHLLFLLLLLPSGLFYSQQKYTLDACETAFLKNNFLLLAEQYNLSAADAAIVQAKVWDLPILSGEFNLINPQNNHFLDVGSKGQKALAVQQLIYLGGKHKKQIEFAKSNKELALLQYEQLVRSLKLELRSRFYELFYNQQKVKSINDQLNQLDTLVQSYSLQAAKGNVSMKDVVRLQSLTLSLRSNLTDIEQANREAQTSLRIITGIEEDIQTIEETYQMDLYKKPLLLSPSEGMELCKNNNPDWLFASKTVENSNLFLAWQKSLAVPDLTLGASYDQRGGAFQNQTNITFAIPLPLWNKNKGNIKIAEAMVNQQGTLLKQKELELSTQLSNALSQLRYYQKQYNDASLYQPNFEFVFNGVLQNFQKRNISLIEFTDFIESYNQSVLFLDEIEKQIMIQGQTINYIVSQSVFK